MRRQREDRAKRGGADDGRKLERAAVERDRARELFARHQARHKRRARRPKKSPRRAEDKEAGVNPLDMDRKSRGQGQAHAGHRQHERGD